MRKNLESIARKLATAALDRASLKEARASVSALMKEPIGLDYLGLVYSLKTSIDKAYTGPPSLGYNEERWVLGHVEQAQGYLETLMEWIPATAQGEAA